MAALTDPAAGVPAVAATAMPARMEGAAVRPGAVRVVVVMAKAVVAVMAAAVAITVAMAAVTSVPGTPTRKIQDAHCKHTPCLHPAAWQIQCIPHAWSHMVLMAYMCAYRDVVPGIESLHSEASFILLAHSHIYDEAFHHAIGKWHARLICDTKRNALHMHVEREKYLGCFSRECLDVT